MQLLKSWKREWHSKDAYKAYLESFEWQTKREQVLLRDSYKCRVCNSTNRPEVHHTTYQRLFSEQLSDFITLCDGCHEFLHRIKKENWLTLHKALIYLCKKHNRNLSDVYPKKQKVKSIKYYGEKNFKWLKRHNKL